MDYDDMTEVMIWNDEQRNRFRCVYCDIMRVKTVTNGWLRCCFETAGMLTEDDRL